jgi:hypothetical protein
VERTRRACEVVGLKETTCDTDELVVVESVDVNWDVVVTTTDVNDVSSEADDAERLVVVELERADEDESTGVKPVEVVDGTDDVESEKSVCVDDSDEIGVLATDANVVVVVTGAESSMVVLASVLVDVEADVEIVDVVETTSSVEKVRVLEV